MLNSTILLRDTIYQQRSRCLIEFPCNFQSSLLFFLLTTYLTFEGKTLTRDSSVAKILNSIFYTICYGN